MALTKKRRVFIEEYLKCWNGAEAARRAGYKFPRRQASYLLTIPDINAEIEHRVEELTMEADEVLLRLSEIARGEYAKYVLPDGKIDIARMVEDGKAYLIVKIRELQHGGKHIEFCDMQKALVDIGKHHGLFQERIDVTTSGESIKLALMRLAGEVIEMSEDEFTNFAGALPDFGAGEPPASKAEKP